MRYQRALWWLSLDNALPQNPELTDADYRQRFFADPGLVHFYQCDYVRTFLQANNAACYHALSDYTDPEFVHRSHIASDNPPIGARANRICFFPNKGAELAAQFIEQREASRHTLDFVPIRGMTKPQVRKTLFGARIYLDFGGHPGKDRVPREAAVAGAVVLLHAAGAARHFTDHPLAAEYLFTDEDVASGRLREKVDAVLDAPETHFAAQRFYRDGHPARAGTVRPRGALVLLHRRVTMSARILVVGAGFAGAVHARELAEAGFEVDVIDRRSHIAGNAYDEVAESGVRIHRYGPHLFHTNNEKVVRWLSRFAAFVPYEHRVQALLGDGCCVPLPINIDTINRVFGVRPRDRAGCAQLPAQPGAAIRRRRMPLRI